VSRVLDESIGLLQSLVLRKIFGCRRRRFVYQRLWLWLKHRIFPLNSLKHAAQLSSIYAIYLELSTHPPSSALQAKLYIAQLISSTPAHPFKTTWAGFIRHTPPRVSRIDAFATLGRGSFLAWRHPFIPHMVTLPAEPALVYAHLS
jgi:hypothetical protein